MGDFGERNGACLAVEEAHCGPFAFAVAQARDHGRERDHAHRQHGSAHQVIEEGTLARLEPSEHGDVDPVTALQQLVAGAHLRLQVAQAETLGQAGQLIQCARKRCGAGRLGARREIVQRTVGADTACFPWRRLVYRGGCHGWEPVLIKRLCQRCRCQSRSCLFAGLFGPGGVRRCSGGRLG